MRVRCRTERAVEMVQRVLFEEGVAYITDEQGGTGWFAVLETLEAQHQQSQVTERLESIADVEVVE